MQDHTWRKPQGLPTIDGKKTQVIAWLQIIGGIAGIAIIFFSIGDQPMTMILYSFLAPFVISVVSGVGLLRKTRMSLLVSRILWAIQIPAFSGPVFGYSLAIGFGLIIGYLNGSYSFNFHFGADMFYAMFDGESKFGLGVNLFAIPVFRYLLKIPLDSVTVTGTEPAIFDQMLGVDSQQTGDDISRDGSDG